MKFNRQNYEKLRAEHERKLQEAKDYRKEYKSKNRPRFIVITLAWWTLIFCLAFVPFFRVILGSLGMLNLVIIFGPVGWYHLLANWKILILKPEEEVMEMLARDNGGVYVKELRSVKGEKAVIFKQGNERGVMGEIIYKEPTGETVRFLRYFFSTGSDKSKQTYWYQILGIKFSGFFPHMYLNYRKNKYGVSIGQPLSLPTEFEESFTLSIPKGYHLEALQVFTPDILAAILDLPFKCDIEFIDDEVLFVLEGAEDVFKDWDLLEKEVAGAKYVVSLLKPKLERINWAPVGDLSYHLQ